MEDQPLHILLVEDDESFRYALAERLREGGLAVAEAAGFADALARIEDAQPVDLLVTDVMMQVHGFALARMARSRRPALPIVYVTGREHVPADELATAYGPVLSKANGVERLAAEITAMLAAAAGAMPPPALATVPAESEADRAPSPQGRAIGEFERRLGEGRRMLAGAERRIARSNELIERSRDGAPDGK